MSAVEAERTAGVADALPRIAPTRLEPPRLDPIPAEVHPSPKSIRQRKRPEPRWLAQIAIDFSCFVLAALVGVTIRLDFDVSPENARAALLLGIVMGVLQMTVGYANGLYRGRSRYTSFDNVLAVTVVDVVITVFVWVAIFITRPTGLPRSLAVVTGVLALLFMFGVRFIARWWWLRQLTRAHHESTIIVGAGENGEQLVRAMVSDKSSPFLPVALLDDDPAKRRLRLYGVPVKGRTSDLDKVLRDTGARNVVVAISNAEAAQLLDFDTVCRRVGAKLRVVPSSSQVVGGAVTLGDISEVTDEDLLGRHPVEVNEEGITELFRGKRVLITGAGGSIGSELSRQMHRYSPAALYLLDRDESALHQVSLSIDGRALLDGDNLVLADIRDHDRLSHVFDMVRPDIVFHAAALKHMPLLEQAPLEAWKTNVLATKAVVDLAVSYGVSTFVNISTDKAADAENVLGYSKRITERVVAGAKTTDDTHFISVRFGNVLGSRGSVLTAFRAQIARGGPVTVTDPDVSRYFMTVAEAVHLVLQAASLGERNGVLVLDMGEPMRIVDVAHKLIEKSGRDIRVEFTGLRPGEKLHEKLFCSDEVPRSTSHPRVSFVETEPLLDVEVAPLGSDAEALALLVLYGSAVPVARQSESISA